MGYNIYRFELKSVIAVDEKWGTMHNKARLVLLNTGELSEMPLGTDCQTGQLVQIPWMYSVDSNS